MHIGFSKSAHGLISICRGKYKLSGPQRKEKTLKQPHGRQEHAPVQRLSNLYHSVVKELQYVCTIPWALIERVKEETSSRTQKTKLVIITNDAMPKSDKVVRVSGVRY